jgi:uncharacterized protein YukE
VRWTAVDPGAGDLTVARAAATWCNGQIIDLEAIESAMGSILTGVGDGWAGEAADEFARAVSSLRARASDSRETLHVASKAYTGYADTVDQIAREAVPLREALSVAQGVVKGGAVTFRSEQEWQAQFQAVLDANRVIETTTAALVDLAERRAEADAVLARTLVVEASEAWSLTVPLPSGVSEQFDRQHANAQVWSLLGHWASGDETAFVLGQEDPFVDRFRQSAFIRELRENVRRDFQDGTLSTGFIDRSGAGVREPSDWVRRLISNDVGVLLKDGVAVGTALLHDPQRDLHPGFENLPESMLGSYEVRYYADDPAPDGSVTITYVVTNETSVDSGTRVPLTGGQHVPIVYDVLTELGETNGSFRTQQQMIVWSERVYP